MSLYQSHQKQGLGGCTPNNCQTGLCHRIEMTRRVTRVRTIQREFFRACATKTRIVCTVWREKQISVARTVTIPIFEDKFSSYSRVLRKKMEKGEKKQRTGSICSAMACKNNKANRPDLSFHRFPLDPLR